MSRLVLKLKEFKKVISRRKIISDTRRILGILRRFRYIVFLVLIVAFFAFTIWGKVFVKTLLLIPSVWPDAKIKPLDLFSKEPIKEETVIESANEKIAVEIYRPADKKKHPTIVLSIIGLTPDSKMMVNYIKGFARVGFVVAVPKIELLYNVNSFYFRYADVDHLVNTFKVIANKEYVDKNKLGFFGSCSGGAYALKAAETPEIATDVRFILTVSPWFTADKIFKAIYLRLFEENGKLNTWTPAAIAVEPTTRSVIRYATKQDEWQLLEDIIDGKLPPEKLSGVSADGRSVYDFVTNRNPAKYEELKARLPWEKFDLNKLSPSTDIKNLKAKVYVLTDRRDSFVPHTESEDLKNSLPAGQVRKTDLELLEHTQLSRRLPRLSTVVDLAKLTFFTWRMLLEIGIT